MLVAYEASDKTVSSLLSWGASPDKTDAEGKTALMSAIQYKCVTTINLAAEPGDTSEPWSVCSSQ